MREKKQTKKWTTLEEQAQRDARPGATSKAEALLAKTSARVDTHWKIEALLCDSVLHDWIQNEGARQHPERFAEYRQVQREILAAADADDAKAARAAMRKALPLYFRWVAEWFDFDFDAKIADCAPTNVKDGAQ